MVLVAFVVAFINNSRKNAMKMNAVRANRTKKSNATKENWFQVAGDLCD